MIEIIIELVSHFEQIQTVFELICSAIALFIAPLFIAVINANCEI